MRYIRYACIAAFAIVLVAISVANRGVVTLRLIPDEVAGWFPMNPQIELPLFIVILIGILVGLCVGFAWEWIREHTHRAEASREGREKRRLQREVARLKTEKNEGKDEVLALLDEAS